MAPRTVPHLPRTAADGAEVCDQFGNRWQYEAEQDAWISKGTIDSAPTVSETQDGLVTPAILAKLQKLRQFVDSGFDFSPLKLWPGTDAYWYNFRSGDRMFRFTPESESVLRIEVDKSKLYQTILRNPCPGKRGAQGDKGEKGLPGLPGPGELCFAPSAIVGNRLDFAIFTPTPLTLAGPVSLPNNHVPDVSLRLYQLPTTGLFKTLDQLQQLAIHYHTIKDVAKQLQHTRNELAKDATAGAALRCGVALSPVLLGSPEDIEPSVTILVDPTGEVGVRVTADEALGIDAIKTSASISYDSDLNLLCGSVYLKAGKPWPAGWCLRSRQRGPDGPPGDPGECRVRIVEQVIDGDQIIAMCPLVNVRYSKEFNTLYTVCADLLAEFCVRYMFVMPISDTLVRRSALKSPLAAVEVSLDECKRIGKFEISIEDVSLPELDLTHWEPQPGLVTRRHFNKHRFDWVQLTAQSSDCSSIAKWYSASGVRNLSYPHAIQTAQIPESAECCAEPFFLLSKHSRRALRINKGMVRFSTPTPLILATSKA